MNIPRTVAARSGPQPLPCPTVPVTRAAPRVYYEDHGAGEPLLAIPGFGSSSAVFAPIVAVSGGGVRWVTCDLPATGRSSSRALAWTTGGLALSAARVLDELGLDTAHIAGASLGGAIALQAALRVPHRVRSLILMGTTAAGPLGRRLDPRELLAVTARVASGSLRRRRPWLAPAIFSPDFLAREPDRADELLRLVSAHPPTPWGLAGQYVAAAQHDVAGDLDRISVPTLILHAERDVLVPVANADQLARGVADSELHIFPGAGHAFGLEHPATTASIIRDWAQRHPVAGTPPP
jgi:3-oxoadipate enol-lactonase